MNTMPDTWNCRLSLRIEKLEQLPQMKRNDQLALQDAKLHPDDREAI